MVMSIQDAVNLNAANIGILAEKLSDLLDRVSEANKRIDAFFKLIQHGGCDVIKICGFVDMEKGLEECWLKILKDVLDQCKVKED